MVLLVGDGKSSATKGEHTLGQCIGILDRDQKAQINIVTEAVQHQTFIHIVMIPHACVCVRVRCRFYG